ncbi:MAG: hypothetical protein ACYTEZ_14620 [Planctomycetota bacterium]|jgi:hypothetical protein
MRAPLAVVSLCLLALGVDAAPRLTWHHEGLARLPAAAAEAQRTHKRLLVGLSGSGT